MDAESEFESFGGIMLIEFGLVFKSLYVDRLDTKAISSSIPEEV